MERKIMWFLNYYKNEVMFQIFYAFKKILVD